MTITIIKKSAGKKASPEVRKLTSDATYGVRPGQVYLRADGELHGLCVLSIDLKKSEALVVHAYPQGWGKEDSIDLFKMAMVRYYEAEKPDWFPAKQ